MCAKHLSRLPRVFCHMPVLRHDSKIYESIDLDQSSVSNRAVQSPEFGRWYFDVIGGDGSLQDDGSDTELAQADAAFGRLLGNWYWTGTALSAATSENADELRLYQLQRENHVARQRLAKVFQQSDRSPTNDTILQRDDLNVTHAPRAYGRVSR